MKKTLYWHDYETFGIDPKRDRPAQFAGIRTDEDLNIIGEPLVIYCQPANDFLPSPHACLVTHISPQHALEQGLKEAEFISQINAEFSQPGTCVVGYNNLRFDDEFTRYTLYRNFFDAYAREWQNNNSRWDIIDLLRITKALRPDGIHWPKRDDGMTSFKLEQLSQANNIKHANAHDALSDVLATIEVARLVKQTQPRLYQFIYQHRSKQQAFELVNLQQQTPILHVSGMYPAEKGHLGVVVPICMDSKNKNGLIVYELHSNPSDLIHMNSEQIKHLTFSKTESLKPDEHRLPLKMIHLNKCPVLAPLKTLNKENIQQWGIDLTLCEQHLDILKTNQGLADNVQSAFQSDYDRTPEDVDQSLYSGGFFSQNDKQKMLQIQQCKIEELNQLDFNFDDPRLEEMLFRYRCRNYPETLSNDEKNQWDNYRFHRMTDNDGAASIKLTEYFSTIKQLQQELKEELKKETTDNKSNTDSLKILEQLEQYPQLIDLAKP